MAKKITISMAAALAASAAMPAHATELRKTEPGTVFSDGIVQIGSHKYPLPPGEWRLIARETHKVLHTRNLTQGADIWSGYFINLSENRFRAGIEIAGTESSTAVAGWVPEPCKREDVVFRDTFESNYQYPECLIVNHFVRHLSPSRTWLNDATQWIETHQVAMPATTLTTYYDKYQAGDFVRVRVWINPELAGQKPSVDETTWRRSDWHKDRVGRDPGRSAYLDKFIAWARQLPAATRPGLDGKDSPGTLQDFPDLTK